MYRAFVDRSNLTGLITVVNPAPPATAAATASAATPSASVSLVPNKTLYNHQRSMIDAMSKLEQERTIRWQGNRLMHTNIGVNSDMTSAGKTLTMLGLVQAAPRPVPAQHFVHSDSPHYYEMDVTPTIPMNLNVIVVKHTLIPQWAAAVAMLQGGIECHLVHKSVELEAIRKRLRGLAEREHERHQNDGYQNDGYGDDDGGGGDGGGGVPRVVIVSTTFLRDFVEILHMDAFLGVRLSRIIVDEPQTLQIPLSFPWDADFVWFMCATPFTIIHSSKSYLRRLLGRNNHRGGAERFLKLCLRNDDEYVMRSLNLPEVYYHVRTCLRARMLESLRHHIPANVMRHLNAGDSDGAIRALGCTSGNASTIMHGLTFYYSQRIEEMNARVQYKRSRIESVERRERTRENEAFLARLNADLHSLEQKVADAQATIANIRARAMENDCNICMEACRGRTICKQCKNSFCLECLVTALSMGVSTECPCCRCPMTSNDFVTIVDGPENGAAADGAALDGPTTNIRSKNDELLHMIRDARPDQRFLVFSEFDATFDVLQREIARGHSERRPSVFSHAILKGTTATVQKTLRDFEAGRTPIIMLNGENFGAGMNLHVATDIIIYHQLGSHELFKQIVGRAYRVGRTCPLHIHELVYEGESPMFPTAAASSSSSS